MKKIPTIFMRDERNPGQVYNAINPECQWVFDRGEDGEHIGGVLKKYDGLCCSIHDGMFWKRSIIPNCEKLPPIWQLVQFDDVGKSTIVWEPVDFDSVLDSRFVAGFHNLDTKDDGTYELVGPGIKGNSESARRCLLMRHDHAPSILILNRTFGNIRRLFEAPNSCDYVYGYIFAHPDGRKAKINRTHFGFLRWSVELS